MARKLKLQLPGSMLLASAVVGTLLVLTGAYTLIHAGRRPKKPARAALAAKPQQQEVEKPDDLTRRDLAGQGLAAVPREVLQLQTLRTLNLMNNALVALPNEIGQLTQLEVLGLKSNRLTALPDSIGDLTGLVALYVTDNQLTALPPSIGKLTKLRKLQASFNRLQSLPEEMGDMLSLELFRAAGCPDLHTIPSRLATAPALTWLSLGGSKYCAAYSRNDAASTTTDGGNAWWVAGVDKDSSTRTLPLVGRQAVTLAEKLGDGASGEVFLSQWQASSSSASSSSLSSLAFKLTPKKLKKSRDVAVKVFRDDTSPDGRSIDELEVLCLLEHPALTKVRALLVEEDAEERATPRPVGVIMDVVPGNPLAAKPDHTSVLRCRWEEGKEYTTDYVLRVAKQVAGGLEHMHEKGICHGDLYAHNCVADEKGNATLLDYGASFLYGTGSEVDFERLEVRAFGLFLQDLVERLSSTEEASPQSKRRRSSSPFPTSLSPMITPSLTPAVARALLEDVVAQCLVSEVAQRPTFKALSKQLAARK